MCRFDDGDCASLKLPGMQVTLKIVNQNAITEDVDEYEEENYGKVAGVGLGVFLTIIAMIIGVILCVIGMATPIWLVFFFIGLLLPIIVFLICAFAPTHREVDEKDDDRTDDYIVPRYLILSFIVIFATFALYKLIDFYLGLNVTSRKVDSRVTKVVAQDHIEQVGLESQRYDQPSSVFREGDPYYGNAPNPLMGEDPYRDQVYGQNPAQDPNNPMMGNNYGSNRFN